MNTWAERIYQLSDGLRRRVRRWWLSQRGLRIGSNCWIQDIEVPRNPWDIELNDGVMLDRGVVLIVSGEQQPTPRIRIGKSVYINRHTVIDASLSIDIGENTMFGPSCYVTDHDHGTDLGTPIGQQDLQSEAVVIGSGAWIGAGATILKGVTIGAEAVVAAGAVVTSDVEPGDIVGGIPARVLRQRT